MQQLLKPILREAFDSCPVKLPRSPVKFPLDPNALNIVWHVRSGDVCPHCDNPSYYHTIFSFIVNSLYRGNLTGERGGLTEERGNVTAPQSNLSHQNIIVHQRHFSPHLPHLFSTIPQLVLFNSDDMTRVVETMLHADILVS